MGEAKYEAVACRVTQACMDSACPIHVADIVALEPRDCWGNLRMVR